MVLSAKNRYFFSENNSILLIQFFDNTFLHNNILITPNTHPPIHKPHQTPKSFISPSKIPPPPSLPPKTPILPTPIQYIIQHIKLTSSTTIPTTQQPHLMDLEPEKQQMPLLQQFKQQMLKSWQPVPSLTKTIVTLFIIGVVFLGLGIAMKIFSDEVLEYSVRYDHLCGINGEDNCSMTITINKDMRGPIFVYYELDGYYQNHRLYANSISYQQLKGKTLTQSDASSQCSPIVYNKDLYINISINGKQLDPKGIANPCGIVAYTIFNDSFYLINGSQQINIADTDIAWQSDLKNFVSSNPDTMWIDVSSERFINWVRIASVPNFRKLWGRIDNTLNKGIYTLLIQNKYDVSNLGAKKFFVLAQSNFFGSKNQFLMISYIAVGSLCLLIAIIFLVKKVMKKRKEE